MNQVIIDNALLALSFCSALVISKCMKERKASFWYATFLLFPPLLIFLNMWAHTVAISVLTIKRIQAGSFQYTFTVYSHFLFGITFIILSGLMVHCTRKHLAGHPKSRKQIFQLNILTVLFFLPVGFINPIGFLPVLASFFSSIILFTIKPNRRKSHTGFLAKEKVQL